MIAKITSRLAFAGLILILAIGCANKDSDQITSSNDSLPVAPVDTDYRLLMNFVRDINTDLAFQYIISTKTDLIVDSVYIQNVPNATVFSPDGNTLYTSYGQRVNKTIATDWQTGDTLGIIDNYYGQMLSISDDGKYLLICGSGYEHANLILLPDMTTVLSTPEIRDGFLVKGRKLICHYRNHVDSLFFINFEQFPETKYSIPLKNLAGNAVGIRSASTSPSGDELVYIVDSNSAQYYLIVARTDDLKILAQIEIPAHEYRYSHPFFSPDGNKVYYYYGGGGFEDYDVEMYSLDLETLVSTLLLSDNDFSNLAFGSPAITPDGEDIYLLAGGSGYKRIIKVTPSELGVISVDSGDHIWGGPMSVNPINLLE